MTLLELADLASSNQDTGLSASLEEAREILARLDARPALERLNKIADRKDESQARAALPFGLTARELEVLRFVSQGMTDSAAAAALFISPRTVSQHLRSIYGKLDVSSRAGATRIAIERSLI